MSLTYQIAHCELWGFIAEGKELHLSPLDATVVLPAVPVPAELGWEKKTNKPKAKNLSGEAITSSWESFRFATQKFKSYILYCLPEIYIYVYMFIVMLEYMAVSLRLFRLDLFELDSYY